MEISCEEMFRVIMEFGPAASDATSLTTEILENGASPELRSFSLVALRDILFNPTREQVKKIYQVFEKFKP
ncbi:MAG: hypothetical protein KDD70_09095, partial [Bdellovibrionales bacterium]|nr:hypothetical protein [Bdellovibrionales bacterium]